MPTFEMSLEALHRYHGISPLPHDFDFYWERALADLDGTGLEHTREPADFEAPGLAFEHLWFQGVGNARIHCKLVRPLTTAGPMPGIVAYHGYTHHSGEWFNLLPFAYTGRVVLSMDVRGQGGLSHDTSTADGPSLFGHIVRGAADPDPDQLFYRNVYLDAVKATRILMAMGIVDADRIGVFGNSQGGALSLVAAALNPRIKMAAPIHPFLSDFKRIVEMDLNKGPYEGFSLYFRKYDPLHEHEDAFYNRLGYIDIQNFASRVKASVLWQTGLMDTVCPPSTQFAAYNKLTCPKTMLISPDYAHEPIVYASDRIFRFFADL